MGNTSSCHDHIDKFSKRSSNRVSNNCNAHEECRRCTHSFSVLITLLGSTLEPYHVDKNYNSLNHSFYSQSWICHQPLTEKLDQHEVRGIVLATLLGVICSAPTTWFHSNTPLLPSKWAKYTRCIRHWAWFHNLKLSLHFISEKRVLLSPKCLLGKKL